MPGERVLLVDSSAAVVDMGKAVLEENGYKVTTASNGVAALSHPDLQNFNLIIVESRLDGVDGLETASQIRTDAETFGIPVLLLVPDDEIEHRASQSLRGANGFLGKPFSPSHLVIKAKETLEEQRLKAVSHQYLEASADHHMQELAEQKIQQAVEKKIQIIVERAIQSIVSIIDQRAKKEVDARVTALVSEKEQELVRITVQEVAKSMVEKMAEKKVAEAIDAVLMETTEKTIKRAADSMLPSLVRERVKESVENILPREVQIKVEKATQEKMTEFGEALINVINIEAKKAIPLIAKEKLPEIAERQVTVACEQRIPQLVTAEARGAVANELNMRVKPLMDQESKRIKNVVLIWVFALAILMCILVVVLMLMLPRLTAQG